MTIIFLITFYQGIIEIMWFVIELCCHVWHLCNLFFQFMLFVFLLCLCMLGCTPFFYYKISFTSLGHFNYIKQTNKVFNAIWVKHYEKIKWFGIGLMTKFLSCNDHLQLHCNLTYLYNMNVIKQVAWVAMGLIHHMWNDICM
jgi:hypothetical protein